VIDLRGQLVAAVPVIHRHKICKADDRRSILLLLLEDLLKSVVYHIGLKLLLTVVPVFTLFYDYSIELWSYAQSF